MSSNRRVPGNADVLVFLLNELRKEIEKRGFPQEVQDAAINLESKILDYVSNNGSFEVVTSAYERITEVLRRLKARPEWKNFPFGFLLKLLAKILIELITN